jgi:hypothetical protein
LRTQPTTPNAAVGHCKKDDKNHESYHSQTKNYEILWQKKLPKNGKFTLENIHHNKRKAVYFDKWSRKKHGKKYDGGYNSFVEEGPFGHFWIQPDSLSVFVDRGKRIPEFVLFTVYVAVYIIDIFHDYCF